VNKLTLALALFSAAITGCSTASGPTYSAFELQPRGGVQTFQVDCGGLLAGPSTCTKAARKICGDRIVRTVDSVRTLRDGSNPTSLIFQCDAGQTRVDP